MTTPSRKQLLLIALVSAASGALHADAENRFTERVVPLLEKYCYDCHDDVTTKGNLVLTPFLDAESVVKEHKLWLRVLHQVESQEMPPKKPFPAPDELQMLVEEVNRAVNDVDWSAFRNPGHVPLARLSQLQYRNSIRDVEVKLEKTLNPPERTWNPKTRPELIRPPACIPDDYPEHMRLMFQMLALAMWTDTTRVGSLMFGISQTTLSLNFIPGMNGSHHGVSHHRNVAKNLDQYNRSNLWFTTELAQFIKQLDSIDEGDGSLLDHSVVLFGTCMKDGNLHVPKDLPLVLLGKGGGKLKTGATSAAAPAPPSAASTSPCSTSSESKPTASATAAV